MDLGFLRYLCQCGRQQLRNSLLTAFMENLWSRLIYTSLNRRVGDTWVFVTKEDERQIVHWFSQRKSSLFEMEFQRASGHPHSQELMDAIWGNSLV